MHTLFSKHIRRGFSLIELLVVITIIGILSALVISSLNVAKARSRDTKRVSDIKSISVALELYYQNNGVYPSGTYPTFISPLISGGFMQATPTDPINTGNYVYKYFRITTQTFHMGTALEQDNDALRDDADLNEANFNGGNADCTTAATGGAGTERCYDLRD